MTKVATTEAIVEVLGVWVKDLAVYFYVDGGLVMSNQPDGLQRLFGFLIGLFDWVGLQTNVKKTVRMNFHN